MIVTVTYKGFNGKFFIFQAGVSEYQLQYFEVSQILSQEEAIKVMQRYVNHKFNIALYWDRNGYYVLKQPEGHYQLFDGTTKLPVHVFYTTAAAIPPDYLGKKIHKYQIKRILDRLNYEPNKLNSPT